MFPVSFAKCKQFFNFGDKKFRWFLVFWFDNKAWVQCLFIFFASFVISSNFTACDVKSELLKLGSMNTDKFRIQFFSYRFGLFDRTFISPEVGQLRSEGATQIVTSFGPCVDFGEAKRKSVANPTPKQSTNNAESSGNECYFIRTKFQFWMSLFLGFLGAFS